jgi:hypothetical protein
VGPGDVCRHDDRRNRRCRQKATTFSRRTDQKDLCLPTWGGRLTRSRFSLDALPMAPDQGHARTDASDIRRPDERRDERPLLRRVRRPDSGIVQAGHPRRRAPAQRSDATPELGADEAHARHRSRGRPGRRPRRSSHRSRPRGRRLFVTGGPVAALDPKRSFRRADELESSRPGPGGHLSHGRAFGGRDHRHADADGRRNQPCPPNPRPEENGHVAACHHPLHLGSRG